MPGELGSRDEERREDLPGATAKLDADPATLSGGVDALPHAVPEHETPETLEGLVGGAVATERPDVDVIEEETLPRLSWANISAGGDDGPRGLP